MPVDPLRVLVVATKAPWPPVDGGRLVLLKTIEALAAAGHRIELVAPVAGGPDERGRAAAGLAEIATPHLVPTRPRPALSTVIAGLVGRMPVTVARHARPEVARAVAGVIDGGGIDVVHAEQLHTLPQLDAVFRAGLPVVHRAHNVESLLWDFTACHRGPVARPLLAFEARRMSDFEVRTLARTDATVALTQTDRRDLEELVPGAAVHTVRAPFAAELPPGPDRLPGDPAVVTLTSPSWAPSRAAAERLATVIWPAVRGRRPDAVLHVFGAGHHLDGLDGVVPHPPPADSRTAFPAGAIVVIPERHPTGVPMKALEAWARGLPLVVDRHTAAILEAGDGAELVAADGPGGYADAIDRLAGDDELRKRVVDGGRRALADRHDPRDVAERLVRVYRWAISRSSKPEV